MPEKSFGFTNINLKEVYNWFRMANISKKKNQPTVDELITLPEAAELSGISHSHLRKLVRSGEIWGKRFGQTWVTTEKAVNEYISRDIRPGPKT